MTTLWSQFMFYPSLLYNLTLSRVTSRRWFDRIDDAVILGALPFRSITAILIKENVKGVITLNEEFELKRWVNTEEEWKAANIKPLYLSTPDYVAAPSQTNLKKGVSFILDHRSRQESVYVHCKAGRTRSATVVACYLMQAYKWSPIKAVEFIKSQRPHVWLRKTQLDAIECFYKENVKDKFSDDEV